MTPFDWASLSLRGSELPPPTVGGSPLMSGGHIAPRSGAALSMRQPRTHRCDADERGNDQNGRTQRQFLADLQSVVVNVSRHKGFPRACSGERTSGR
jgi:hypothetical protein